MNSKDSNFFVYIYGDQQRSQVQIGVADEILQKEQQPNAGASVPLQNHENGSLNLVYYEHYNLEAIAVERERQLKETPKDITYHLIDSMNPNWLDLSDTLD
ncbi:excinuclease ABC subunit C [Pontibacter qinzhouensis]|uniref:Excinuclease ABC subunit C n=1 Tax=Pontibacter qinzhouensis TaxID=2603253 RepID=A0A5C8JGA2_9BACT|nr:excinuclease ABC subunit C [Pontibacter qinzhouensis]TXK36422.1 excinuclease ABC subunit C [Pontibacter qinzhouensis]